MPSAISGSKPGSIPTQSGFMLGLVSNAAPETQEHQESYTLCDHPTGLSQRHHLAPQP